MTPEPGTPMVPLSVADAARDVSPGCAYTWAELEGAAVPWPAPPATRDDHHPAEPHSEPRIIWCDEGGDPETPELCAHDVGLHIERMTEDRWMVHIWTEGDDGKLVEDVVLWLETKPRCKRLIVGHVDAQDDVERDLSDAGYSRNVDVYRDRRAALRAAATPTTPAEHVPVPIDDLALVLGTKIAGIRETTEARGRLRAALTAAQQEQTP